MLKRLKIHKFRHVAPGTDLEFSDRFNVLLGKNGTGKTTLLDLISMVLRSDFSTLREDVFGFDFEYVIESRISNVFIRFANESKRIANNARVTIVQRSALPGDSSLLEIDIDGNVMRWRVDGQEWQGQALVDVFDGVFVNSVLRVFSRLEVAHRPVYDIAINLLTLVEQVRDAYRFDESLDTFECITEDAAVRSRKRNRAPFLNLVWRFDSQTPEERVGAVSRVFFPYDYEPDRPEPGQSSVKVHFARQALLPKMTELADLRSLSMSLTVEGSSNTEWKFGHAEFLFSGPTGSTFNHHALSYGQKRLLAFLYYLDLNDRFVVADELVNGMHHDWITACLELIGNRQAFLTSQNPLLLDYLPLESVEQIQRSFVQCKMQSSEYTSQLVWSNLSADDATQLLADYEVGIQQVGELLRVRGLW